MSEADHDATQAAGVRRGNARWFAGAALAFDVESTGVEPAGDRIVSAACIEVGPEGAHERGYWLVNPGVPIPPGATAIHGITDAKVQAEGVSTAAAIPAIAALLRGAWDAGMPVIACNAPFDLSMLDHELWRCAHSYLKPGPVFDPLVIDRGMDPYRAGSRKLDALAKHYGAFAGAAHDCRGDALTAARVVWAQAGRYPELPWFKAAEMGAWQREAHRKWAENFEQYRARKGEPVTIDRSWPMRVREVA